MDHEQERMAQMRHRCEQVREASCNSPLDRKGNRTAEPKAGPEMLGSLISRYIAPTTKSRQEDKATVSNVSNCRDLAKQTRRVDLFSVQMRARLRKGLLVTRRMRK